MPGPVVGIIETTTKLSDRFHLCTATSLSSPDPDGMVPLRILNPTDAPVLLHKGTSVGIFSETAPEDIVLSLEPTDGTIADDSFGSISKASENTLLSKFKCLPSEALSALENN